MKNTRAISFEDELFVNRDKAKQEFFHCLTSKRAPAYLEFHGVAGLGKTELLKWIAANPKQERYDAAYLDLERAQFYHPNISPLLSAIADQLTGQINPHLFQGFQELLPDYLEELRLFHGMSVSAKHPELPATLKERERRLIQCFLDEICAALTWRKIVVCLDSAEQAYPPAFQRFETQVLVPLSQQPHFFLVIAGQERVLWHSPDIQNRIRPYMLVNLDAKWARKQIDSLARSKQIEIHELDIVLERLLQLTNGHPYSNYSLLKFWTQDFTVPLNEAVTEQYLAEGIQHLMTQILDRRILARTSLGEQYPPARKILWFLAPLRHIELSMFRYALAKYLPEWFEGKPFTLFERLIGKFQSASILTRWHLGSGSNINPVVRNMLLCDMRLNTPDFFLSMTRDLAQQYRLKVERTHDATQIKNLTEYLYHYATYLNATQPNYDNVEEVKEELAHVLSTFFTLDSFEDELALREQLNRLHHALYNDEELANLIEVPQLLTLVLSYMEGAEERQG